MDIRIVRPSADADYYVVNPHDVRPPEFSGSRAKLLAYAEEQGWPAQFMQHFQRLEAHGRFSATLATAAEQPSSRAAEANSAIAADISRIVQQPGLSRVFTDTSPRSSEVSPEGVVAASQTRRFNQR